MSETRPPLAARMRPTTLDAFVGQSHIVGPGTHLRRSIETDRLTSAIFWGPPGVGKSTLARIIAKQSKAIFEDYSAVTSGVADIRLVIDRARKRREVQQLRTLLFVDEIHRWNKSQQDALLPHVEEGIVVLIGATTENPSFALNAPLLSRARVYRFKPLERAELLQIIEFAISDKVQGLGELEIKIEPEAAEHLIVMSDGDARSILNILEAAAQRFFDELRTESSSITLKHVEEAAQQRALRYDRDGDEHYDTISAFIKSVRGSDPDAALVWLAKMLQAGEDPRFIVRRLIILASEDIGNADPMGLVLATSAMDAVSMIGMPEARYTLGQVTTYLASAPKSNASAMAIGRALADVESKGAPPVPVHLRDASYTGAKRLGHGKGYLYPHDFPENYVDQKYVPDGAISEPYYIPTDNGHEAKLKARLTRLRERDVNS